MVSTKSLKTSIDYYNYLMFFSGIWVMWITWIERSFKAGKWLAEEPFESELSHNLPKYHRLRAMEARAAAARGGYIGSSAAGASEMVHSGGIFVGWTMCIKVEKSISNRSFGRLVVYHPIQYVIYIFFCYMYIIFTSTVIYLIIIL